MQNKESCPGDANVEKVYTSSNRAGDTAAFFWFNRFDTSKQCADAYTSFSSGIDVAVSPKPQATLHYQSSHVGRMWC